MWLGMKTKYMRKNIKGSILWSKEYLTGLNTIGKKENMKDMRLKGFICKIISIF